MNKKTVDKYKARRKEEKPEISDAEHRANVNDVLEMLFNVAERIPADAPPVVETMDELMAQLKNSTAHPPVIVQLHTGERVTVANGELTEIAHESVSELPAEVTKDKFVSDAEKQNELAADLLKIRREKYGIR